MDELSKFICGFIKSYIAIQGVSLKDIKNTEKEYLIRFSDEMSQSISKVDNDELVRAITELLIKEDALVDIALVQREGRSYIRLGYSPFEELVRDLFQCIRNHLSLHPDQHVLPLSSALEARVRKLNCDIRQLNNRLGDADFTAMITEDNNIVITSHKTRHQRHLSEIILFVVVLIFGVLILFPLIN
jgi:hypothetical protein